MATWSVSHDVFMQLTKQWEHSRLASTDEYRSLCQPAAHHSHEYTVNGRELAPAGYKCTQHLPIYLMISHLYREHLPFRPQSHQLAL